MIGYQLSLLALLLVSHQGLTLSVQNGSDPSIPFQLIVTPALANRYTPKNISLRCESNPSVPNTLTQIFRTRIVKKSLSGWDLIAEQRDNEDTPTVVGNVSATGNTKGALSNVFLEISCNPTKPDCFGIFRCEVIGSDVTDKSAMVSSSIIEVDEFNNLLYHLVNVSADTQEKGQDMENFIDTKISKLSGGCRGLSRSVVTMGSVFEIGLDKIQSSLESFEAASQERDSMDDMRFKRFECSELSYKDRLAKLERVVERLNQWPSGNYALLQPKLGCPADLAFFSKTRSFLKIHTQSQSSSDPANGYSAAFARQTTSTDGSQKFVTLEFCEVTTKHNTTEWPRGSFCIHKLYTMSCPPEFAEGYVYMDTEDTNAQGDGSTNVPKKLNDPTIYFCCQTTSPASVPIELPTHSPFLLYRHGGVCQAVQGMAVSEEYVQINTEDHDNRDRLSGHHPDIDQPGESVIKFNLCYYTKL
ncbi:MACPF domain-containing protein 2 [Elysia marginata]|uniref:MACPF domain-containing protein 2 n=1 Tax=Elysia marginata TaxID=1093978 RepID=A0AAV4F9A8_9GAST|nr:MACPF domain-containing protein 2 [Elysia marginata]